MKQLLMANDRAFVTRVPRVAVEAGSVLVEVHYSLVSTGTELAPLKAQRNQAAESQGAGGDLSKAVEYLGKAISDPVRAAQRLREIAAGRLRKLARASKQPATLASSTVTDPGWQNVGEGQYTASPTGLDLVSDASPAGYQVISRRIDVAEVDAPDNEDVHHLLEISIRGRIRGQFTLGLLNEDQSAWIAQTTLSEGNIDELLQFACLSPAVYLVVANAGGQGEIKLDEFEINLNAAMDDGLPVSELDQVGWGIGYSVAGEVIAVGPGVTGFRIGDRVACAGAGQANHAEIVSVKQNLVVAVPDGVDLQQACSATVGSIAMQGVRRTKPELGEVICVIGLGLIGMLTVQMLKAAGCRVIGLDLDPSRVSRALELGVDAASSSLEEVQRLCRDATHGHGADATVITAAAPEVHSIANDAMSTTRRRGRVVIVGDVGLHLERPEFYRKEIDLLMSTSYGPGRYDNNYEVFGQDYPYSYVRWTENRNMASFLGLIASGQVSIDKLVDLVVPLDAAPEAYASLADSSVPPMGVVIEYGAASEQREADADTAISIRGARKVRGDKLGYALVGAGAFGTSMLVPQLDKCSDVFQLKAVCSRDPVRGGNFARQRAVPKLVTRLEDVLEDEQIDMVVIATRHDEHAQQVEMALRAGKHVFVEKPLAVDWQGLQRVKSAVAESDALLAVGFNRGCAPAVRAAKEIFAKRTTPLVINYRLNGGFIPADSWIQDRRGAGRNIGEACHMYDLFSEMTGSEVTAVSAQSIDPGDSAYLRNDNFIATTRYGDGSVCSLTYTACGPREGLPKERVEIFGDGQCVVIDDYIKCIHYPSGDVLWSADAADKGHAEQFRRLADSIRSADTSMLPTPQRLLATTALSLHIEDLLQGRVV